MKTTANIAQIKARLSEYLSQVKGGSEVVITERGMPVARLVPLAPTRNGPRAKSGSSDRVRFLHLPGAAAPGRAKLKRGAGRFVLDALLAERNEGRSRARARSSKPSTRIQSPSSGGDAARM